RVRYAAAVLVRDPLSERELMRAQERQGVNEGVDLAQRSLRRAIQSRDDSGAGPRPEPDAHEMSGDEVEAIGDPVGEGARGSADAGEHRDLRRPRHSRGRDYALL